MILLIGLSFILSISTSAGTVRVGIKKLFSIEVVLSGKGGNAGDNSAFSGISTSPHSIFSALRSYFAMKSFA